MPDFDFKLIKIIGINTFAIILTGITFIIKPIIIA